jgi:hypothetical protein
MHNTSVIALVFWCAACGGGDDPATPVDAAPPQIDAAIDAAPQNPAELIGVWVKIPSQVQDPPPPPAERDRMRLASDGTFIYEEEGDDDTGMWSADSAKFTIIGSTSPSGPTSTITSAYRLSGTQLLLPAFLPTGAVTGSVGTWRSVSTTDTKTTTQMVTLRADMTATLEIESDNPRVYQGTWAYEVDDIVVTTMIQTTTVHLHFQEIRGVALGSLFEREVTAQAARPTHRVAGTHIEFQELPAWLAARGH